MPVGTAYVNKNTVEILCDTGCNGGIGRREFVNQEYATGSMGYAMDIDQTLQEEHIAKIIADMS